MATVINTEKKAPKPNPNNPKEKNQKPPLFRKMNYILMGIGVLILIIGYILLGGGGSLSDDVFSDAIFDTRRLVIAPTLILIGLVLGIVAIMYYPRSKATPTELPKE